MARKFVFVLLLVLVVGISSLALYEHLGRNPYRKTDQIAFQAVFGVETPKNEKEKEAISHVVKEVLDRNSVEHNEFLKKRCVDLFNEGVCHAFIPGKKVQISDEAHFRRYSYAQELAKKFSFIK